MKPGTDPNLVMAYLYKHTELQKNFSYNMTASSRRADGKTMVPQDGLSLKEILRHFLDFRLATVRRRFEYRAAAAAPAHPHPRRLRDHLQRPRQGDQDHPRERAARPDAAEKLMKAFKLDDEQTTAILDAQLYKIAQMEIKKILDELKEKKKRGRARSRRSSRRRRSSGASSRTSWRRWPRSSATAARRGWPPTRTCWSSTRRPTSSARTPTSC